MAPAPGTPLQLPGATPMMRLALRLGAHPSQPVVYVGFTLQNKLGVYSYGAAGSFPSSTYAASNYWVDVVFS